MAKERKRYKPTTVPTPSPQPHVDDADAEAARQAQRMVEEAEIGGRDAQGIFKWLIIGLCLSWSLVQLSFILPYFTIAAQQQRALHVFFGVALAFLVFPAVKQGIRPSAWFQYTLLGVAALTIGGLLGHALGIRVGAPWFGTVLAFLLLAGLIVTLRTSEVVAEAVKRFLPNFTMFSLAGASFGIGYSTTRLLSIVTPLDLPPWLGIIVGTAFAAAVILSRRAEQTRSVPWFDIVFALFAALTTLYIVIDFPQLQLRHIRLPREEWMGLMLILILLEATRRSLGPALAIVAGTFFTYQLTGPRGALPWLYDILPVWLNDLIAQAGASLGNAVGRQYITSEGIFGTPVGVSTSIVFLFVLFGTLLEKAGAGKYFIDLANAFLGHFRGGPAKAAVVASGMTGMVSGSSLANTVTTGTFTIPLMKKSGYPAHKAGATEVAVSTNGQLMPPVMGAAAFIIAEFVGVPYIEVVRAVFIPAFIAYFALFYVVHLEALKLGIQGIPRSELPPRFKTFIEGIYYFIPVGVLIYYLVVQQRTAGTAVMQAIIWLVVVILVQSPIKALLRRQPLWPAVLESVRTLYEGILGGARNMVAIAVAVATAGIVVLAVVQSALAQLLPGIIGTLSESLTRLIGAVVLPLVDLLGGNPQAFGDTMQFMFILLIAAVASLILGLGLPTTANYVVVSTLTAPVIFTLGNQLGYGVELLAAHLFVFFFGILADDTPPVGLAAYAAAAIARADPIKTGIQGFTYDMRTAILPFMFIFNERLLLRGLENGTVAQALVSGNLPLVGAVPMEIAVWVEGARIFISALIGMFAFVAGTQGFVRIRTVWYERLVLLAVAFMLIQPTWTTDLVGAALYGLVYVSQWLRLRNPERVPA